MATTTSLTYNVKKEYEHLEKAIENLFSTGVLPEKNRLAIDCCMVALRQATNVLEQNIVNFNPIYLRDKVNKIKIDNPNYHTDITNEAKELSKEDILLIMYDIQQTLKPAYDIVEQWNQLRTFIDSNETLQEEWNRFMVLMKLSGGSDKES